MTPQEAATKFGLRPAGADWRGACPLCSYDAALVVRRGVNGSARPWCANCRDTPGLVRLMGGGDAAPRDNAHAAATAAGEAERTARQREAAMGVWAGSVPLEAREAAPARAYLARRHLLHLVGSAALRYRPDCPTPDRQRLMAMIALITNASGAPTAIQRTFLQPNGEKFDADRPRATKGRYTGAGIWINQPASTVVIGEGLESSASAGVLLGRPAAAAISANNLAGSLILPPVVRDIIIAADADKQGITAAAAAAGRWQAEGRRVRIAKPDKPGSDFNDLLLERPNG